jgi:type II secretory pathway component GspD/PulD (secretin)
MLFRNTTKTKTRVNLVVLLTPHIVNSAREEDRVLFKPLVEANLVELEQVRFEEFWLAS